MNVTKTADGWQVEITNTKGDCLEQGGRCGRVELYTCEQLASCAIGYDDDPEGDYNGFWSNLGFLLARCQPEILNAGTLVE